MAEAGLKGLNCIGFELVIPLESCIKANDASGILLLGEIGQGVDDFLCEVALKADEQSPIGDAVDFAA